MKIMVNGKPVQSKATTIAKLCEEQGYGDQKIATALNGDFIAALARKETALKDGDAVEIVAPRQGG